MRICTYNTNGFKTKVDNILNEVKQTKPDIILSTYKKFERWSWAGWVGIATIFTIHG